ncbi:ABC transporter ATP-binding protein [Ferrovibrio terrae]|uniref:ABC transporter ATP-binding protein n=1 Tax=Ferrovibrio terrae TaxID=2594003 RepID=UPI0031378274
MSVRDSDTDPAFQKAGQSLTLDAITHRFGSATAVDDVTLDIRAGELVSLLGPSGCGKTTLLRIVAGFINQTMGRVIIGGTPIDDLPPNRRSVGIVFQNYALFPHLTVADNIAYGLAARGTDRAAQRVRVEEMLALVQMHRFADRYPRQLSGGQQQRIALARALAVQPRILLLDEPFAALDKNLRLDMQIEIKRIQKMSGITAVMVTHDQEEALGMSDRIAVLSQGRLEQFGTPSQIYDRPETLFVNTFVGTSNLLPGHLESSDATSCAVRLDDGLRLVLPRSAEKIVPGTAVLVSVRPDNLVFVDGGEGLAGQVELGMPLGTTIVHEIVTASGRTLKVSSARSAGAQPLASGTPIRVVPASLDAVQIFPAPKP